MKYDDLRTHCCNAQFIRLGRARYQCKTCKREVSLELIFLIDCIEEGLNYNK